MLFWWLFLGGAHFGSVGSRWMRHFHCFLLHCYAHTHTHTHEWCINVLLLFILSWAGCAIDGDGELGLVDSEGWDDGWYGNIFIRKIADDMHVDSPVLKIYIWHSTCLSIYAHSTLTIVKKFITSNCISAKFQLALISELIL